LVLEQKVKVWCGRYKRSKTRQGYRNGSYLRDLLTSYGWIDGLKVLRIRKGGIDSRVLERYRRRQRQVDRGFFRGIFIGSLLETNNPIERYLQELRRRIIPMRAFNNSRSVERIIYGLLAYVLNQQEDMPIYEFTQLS
jgi:transposase-like protein